MHTYQKVLNPPRWSHCLCVVGRDNANQVVFNFRFQRLFGKRKQSRLQRVIKSRLELCSRGWCAHKYQITLKRVNITPLACTISLSCNKDEAYLDEHIQEIFRVFSDEGRDCSLTLANGTVLNNGQFEATPSGGAEGFTLILALNGPITVNDVVSLSLFGIECPLDQAR